MTETDRPTFLFIKKLVLSSKDKERAARGGVRRHAPPETPAFCKYFQSAHTELTAPVLKSSDFSKL